MSDKITFEEAKKRFIDQGRTDIELCEDEYIGWCLKAKFYDLIQKDYFYNIVRVVCKYKLVHPKRRCKGISFKQAKERFDKQGREDIEICEDGYKGWMNKSKFYDKVAKKFFYQEPHYVLSHRCKHKSRRKKAKTYPIIYSVARQRFIDQGRGDEIELREEEYTTWTKKAKFYDIKNNSYFYSVPSRVYAQKSSDPKFKTKKTKETLQKTYGSDVTNISQISAVKQLKEEIFLEKYGVKTNLQVPVIKEKIKEGWVQKYGTEYPQQSEGVKKKQEETVLKKYGVRNYFMSTEFFILHSRTNRFIKETGEHLKKWLEKQSEPKPPYNIIRMNFPNEEISLEAAEKFVKDYVPSIGKSTLEIYVEKLLGVEHFNKTLKENNIKNRPDFKLSESVYLNADGLYWHSEEKKGEQYHFDLRKRFESENIRMLQIRENEFYNKPQVVIALINYVLCAKQNIKDTFPEYYINNITNIGILKKFLNENSIKDIELKNIKHIGLYNKVDDEMLSVISYKIKKNVCYIQNFCFKTNFFAYGDDLYNITLKHLEEELKIFYNNEIKFIYQTLDMRYEDEDLLLNNNFEFEKEYLDWEWTNKNDVFTKKSKINEVKSNCHKLFDAGQRTYIKNLFETNIDFI
jgi:hypothetical protein